MQEGRGGYGAHTVKSWWAGRACRHTGEKEVRVIPKEKEGKKTKKQKKAGGKKK